MKSNEARRTRDRSVPPSLQIWVSTNSSISQLTFFYLIIYQSRLHPPHYDVCLHFWRAKASAFIFLELLINSWYSTVVLGSSTRATVHYCTVQVLYKYEHHTWYLARVSKRRRGRNGKRTQTSLATPALNSTWALKTAEYRVPSLAAVSDFIAHKL